MVSFENWLYLTSAYAWVIAGVNEIQSFVNLALATGAIGEGDLSHDRLSHLRTVGRGFASLIYNFPEHAGFLELKEACTSVWEALAENKNLPYLLVNGLNMSYLNSSTIICMLLLLSTGGLQQRHRLVSVCEGDTGISRGHLLWANEEHSEIWPLPSWHSFSITHHS